MVLPIQPPRVVSLRKLRDSYGTYRVDSDLDLAGALRAQICSFAGALRAQLWLSSGITRHCLPDHAHVPWHILAPLCFQTPKSPIKSIRRYALDQLSMMP